MRKRNILIALLASTALLHAGRLEDRWAKSHQWADALAAAQKADKPIVILYGFHHGSGYSHDGMLDRFMAERAFESWVRVVNYVSDKDGPARSYFGLADGTNGLVPEVYFVEPKTKRLIGFVDYSRDGETAAQAKSAASVVRWREKSDKAIEKADTAAQAGRFKSGLRDIEDIAQEDAKLSYQIERRLGVKYDPDRQPTDSTDNQAGTRSPDPRDPASKPPSRDEEKAKDDKADKEDAEAAKTARGTFYPNLVQEKRDEYGALADKRIEESRAALQKKDFTKARAAIAVMIIDGSDLPQVAVAKSLMDEITAAAKSK